MKKVLIRSLFLVCAYGFVVLIIGCNPCRCGDYLPFYDFENAILFAEKTTYMDSTGTDQPGIILELQPTDVEYLASGECSHFLNFGGLYACSCPISGEEGLKFPISRVDIYSEDDFNDSLVAGSSLNAMFSYTWPGAPTFETQELNRGLQNMEFGKDCSSIPLKVLYPPMELSTYFWK